MKYEIREPGCTYYAETDSRHEAVRLLAEARAAGLCRAEITRSDMQSTHVCPMCGTPAPSVYDDDPSPAWDCRECGGW